MKIIKPIALKEAKILSNEEIMRFPILLWLYLYTLEYRRKPRIASYGDYKPSR